MLTVWRRRGGFTPASVPSLLAGWEGGAAYWWQDAAQTTPWAADGDPVGAWASRFGSFLWTQSTNALRLTGRSVGGKDWLDFGGTQYLTLGDLSASLPTAATLVIQAEPGSGFTLAERCLMETQNLTDYYRYTVDGLSYPSELRMNRLGSQPALPTSGAVTLTVRSSASGWRRRVNGTQDVAAAAAYGGGTAWTLGVSGDLTRYWKGKVVGLAIAAADLSDTDTAALEAYYAAKA